MRRIKRIESYGGGRKRRKKRKEEEGELEGEEGHIGQDDLIEKPYIEGSLQKNTEDQHLTIKERVQLMLEAMDVFYQQSSDISFTTC